MTKHPLQRALWPEVVYSADLARVLDIDEGEAARALRAGRFGDFFEVNGRVAVLRRDVLAALSGRASNPPDRKEVVGEDPDSRAVLRPDPESTEGEEGRP